MLTVHRECGLSSGWCNREAILYSEGLRIDRNQFVFVFDIVKDRSPAICGIQAALEFWKEPGRIVRYKNSWNGRKFEAHEDRRLESAPLS